MKSQKVVRFNMALKVAILQSGMTQRRIARRSRIDETRLSRIISQQVQSFPFERQALARVLKCSEAELFEAAA